MSRVDSFTMEVEELCGRNGKRAVLRRIGHNAFIGTNGRGYQPTLCVRTRTGKWDIVKTYGRGKHNSPSRTSLWRTDEGKDHTDVANVLLLNEWSQGGVAEIRYTNGTRQIEQFGKCQPGRGVRFSHRSGVTRTAKAVTA